MAKTQRNRLLGRGQLAKAKPHCEDAHGYARLLSNASFPRRLLSSPSVPGSAWSSTRSASEEICNLKLLHAATIFKDLLRLRSSQLANCLALGPRHLASRPCRDSQAGSIPASSISGKHAVVCPHVSGSFWDHNRGRALSTEE